MSNKSDSVASHSSVQSSGEISANSVNSIPGASLPSLNVDNEVTSFSLRRAVSCLMLPFFLPFDVRMDP